jgi:hypothetical protein
MKKILTMMIIIILSAVVFAYNTGAPSGDELMYKAESDSSFRPMGMAACGARGPLQYDGRQGIYDRYRVQCFCTKTPGGSLTIPARTAMVLWDRNKSMWAGR